MATKEQIVDSITDMFVRDGIKAIRMDDIAEALSMSKRTLYKVFSDKESLLTECIRNYHDRILKHQKETTREANNVIEEFLITLQNWETFAEQGYQLMSSLRKFYPEIFRQLSKERYDKSSVDLRRKLEQGIEQGLFLNDINIDLSISVFTFSLYGIISGKETALPNNVSQSDAFKYVTTYFFRGIATDKGIKLLDSCNINTNK